MRNALHLQIAYRMFTKWTACMELIARHLTPKLTPKLTPGVHIEIVDGPSSAASTPNLSNQSLIGQL